MQHSIEHCALEAWDGDRIVNNVYVAGVIGGTAQSWYKTKNGDVEHPKFEKREHLILYEMLRNWFTILPSHTNELDLLITADKSL